MVEYLVVWLVVSVNVVIVTSVTCFLYGIIDEHLRLKRERQKFVLRVMGYEELRKRMWDPYDPYPIGLLVEELERREKEMHDDTDTVWQNKGIGK